MRKIQVVAAVLTFALILSFLPPGTVSAATSGVAVPKGDDPGLFGIPREYIQLGTVLLTSLILPTISYVKDLGKRIESQNKKIEDQDRMIRSLYERLAATDTSNKASVETLARSMNSVMQGIDRLTERFEKFQEKVYDRSGK